MSTPAEFWATGDYDRIAALILEMGQAVVAAAGIRSGQRVLDVGAGTGNATLPAAATGAEVVGTDITPQLLEVGERNARARGLDVSWQLADAQDLPFDDDSFDVVLSCVGAMFAPDQRTTARELLRVCRPGGTIALASWTPDGFIGQLLRTVGRFVPPPAGLRSPSLWGTEAHIAALVGDRAKLVSAERRDFLFRYRSAEHFVEFFRDWYGPTHKAFGALPAERQADLAAEIADLARKFDRGGGRSLAAAGEYLEVVLEKR